MVIKTKYRRWNSIGVPAVKEGAYGETLVSRSWFSVLDDKGCEGGDVFSVEGGGFGELGEGFVN
jgi:hypothetical protein